MLAQPALTPRTCVRLADLSEESVFSTSPVVRFLVIRDAVTFREGERTNAYEAYITDGDGYAWIALASALNGRVCNEDERRSLQVGSVARISGISRLQQPDTCIALIRDFELLDASSILPAVTDHCAADTSITYPVKSISVAHSDLQQERAARLLTEMKLREERKRRVILERALADVCRDLHRKNALVPAALKALETLDALADAAMIVDRGQTGDE
ncbi:hypothetical protein L226DRAFT_243064 [Lentinus tigrinus ALCF2SS1-7]|nr:hypothetical protein L226DRAFT_243064 [Lentinus tigrinus ALCF2SS1-7]